MESDTYKECPKCNGQGSIVVEENGQVKVKTCPKCGGEGVVSK